MKVFCIGLGRTGTTTFQECMTQLGFRHRGWRGPYLAALAKIEVTAIFPLVEAYDSFDDYPFPLIYKDLDRHFPGSKFVLTLRKEPRIWAESVESQFYRKGFNEGDQLIYGSALVSDCRLEKLETMYREHVGNVRDHFGSRADLIEICWESGDGWPELCGFLGLPIPQGRLPHANRRDRDDNSATLAKHCERSRYAAALRLVEHCDDPALEAELHDHLLARMASEIGRSRGIRDWLRSFWRRRAPV